MENVNIYQSSLSRRVLSKENWISTGKLARLSELTFQLPRTFYARENQSVLKYCLLRKITSLNGPSHFSFSAVNDNYRAHREYLSNVYR